VAAVLAAVGIVFELWQVGIAKLILAKRADGQYAADLAVMSIPRQVGKTFMLGSIVFALCVLSPRLLVIWTAHHSATADETFADMQALARQPRMAKHIKRVLTGDGRQDIIFHNGSRIRFGARERGFGRGFKRVGILVLDEAQKLSQSAMDNLIPTTNRAANPLILLAGTPPEPGATGSEVFTTLRAEALEGDSETLYVEFSADQDADVHDRSQWRKANPSYPKHTTARAILRMLKALGPASFRREALGIWSEHTGAPPEIDANQWAAGMSNPDLLPARAYGVRFSPGGDRMALAVAALTDDDRVFVEVLDSGPTSVGLGGLTQWLSERWEGADAIVIDGLANAGLLNEALLEARVPARRIKRTGPADVTTASARLVELVRFKRLAHAGQPGLTEAATRATRRLIGTQGGWGFECSDSTVDMPALEAVALAISGLRDRPSTYDNDNEPSRRTRGSSGRTAGVM
jgi:hypothetical protein